MQERIKNRKGYYGVKLHQILSFSSIFQKAATFGGEWGFFPGCSMMGYSPELILRVYRWLKKADPSIGLVSGCCGHPTLALDDMARFEAYQRKVGGEMRRAGLKKLIVCCPNCEETLRNIKWLTVRSIWSMLDEANFTVDASGDAKYVLHDPCPTRRDPDTQEAFRRVIKRCSVNWEEYPSSRDKALCCGKIKMLMVLDPETGHKVLERRISESDNNNVLTYCFSCADSFRGAGCNAVHGLELLFPGNINARSTWKNRYESAKSVERFI